jgi:hypothetical protein
MNILSKIITFFLPNKTKCIWEHKKDYIFRDWIFATSCGREFYLSEGKPTDPQNNMPYCCFCGRELEVKGDD